MCDWRLGHVPKLLLVRLQLWNTKYACHCTCFVTCTVTNTYPVPVACSLFGVHVPSYGVVASEHLRSRPHAYHDRDGATTAIVHMPVSCSL